MVDSRIILICVAEVVCLGLGIGLSEPEHAKADAPGLVPLPLVEKAAPELALLMGDLQRLTHKMALSADAGNAELAEFYLHESLEQLKAIQQEAPVYEDQPVALFIDRLALPNYEPFRDAVQARPYDRNRMLSALDGVIASCNQCHVATKHPLIRITRGTGVNPFNQSFEPTAP
jgi:hypothetical protein